MFAILFVIIIVLKLDYILLSSICSVIQSCPTLCDPIDCSLPGSSVHGILQARVLEWAAIFLLQGILPTQGSNLRLLHLLHWQADSLPRVPLGKGFQERPTNHCSDLWFLFSPTPIRGPNGRWKVKSREGRRVEGCWKWMLCKRSSRWRVSPAPLAGGLLGWGRGVSAGTGWGSPGLCSSLRQLWGIRGSGQYNCLGPKHSEGMVPMWR